MDRSTWYWFRLPEGERDRLVRARTAMDTVTVLQMLNRYLVSPHPLSLCCDIELAFTHVDLFLTKPDSYVR